ncbi:hypothetical protein EK0264_10655 [Epidermidibacterium keratini]|uniref:DUF2142 domain-containing protein n=1 Tax=Epidermidibacterium keratini TaxID=1891644 RepID=A0A7L4YNU3_9ACTN|nr:hypothetical protein [Epidermidibacterium keratini]QHC00702.1 hypothetical protein EK0264_10655 [Epidermidibacterium keratini]
MSVSSRHTRPRRARIRSGLTVVVFALFTAVFSQGLMANAQDGHPLSLVDEHIHFDTVVKATRGDIPYRGQLLGQEVVEEWACGVGHQGGPTSVPCGDPNLSAESLPSGKYTSGYGHYPTYFFLAAWFQPLWASVTGDDDLLNGYRAFSAILMILGVLAAGLFAWLLGLRGSRLLAAVAVPVASSQTVLNGIIVNPGASAVLCGVLIAGTGLLWVQRDRGFVWFALAVTVAAVTAVTNSLPAGGFLIAMLVVLLGRRRWPRFAEGWRPRWWQLIMTAAIMLVPVVVWGRFIAARATVANDVLYGWLPEAGGRDITVGATQELFALHTPWRETDGITSRTSNFFASELNAISLAAPVWITVLVFGGLVALLWRAAHGRARTALSAPSADPVQTADSHVAAEATVITAVGSSPRLPASARSVSGLDLVVLGSLLTVVAYPPAMRISQWLNFGINHGIVDRYSTALAPILVFVLLVLIGNRTFSRALAVVGMLTALGTVAGAV